jgi:methyl-accepting chemotaxis protein
LIACAAPQVAEQKGMTTVNEEAFLLISDKINEISRNNNELMESVKKANNDALFNEDKLRKVNGITKSVTKAITVIIEDIKKINDRAAAIVKLAKSGSSVTGSEIQAMSSIKNAVIESTDVIEKLRLSSKQIKGIVNTVAEIAKKTNMLSLNAGIEAARAGEAGKSFAVVAQEIRSLAEGATKATQEISDFLQRTEELAQKAVAVISEQNRVEDAVNVVYSASDSFIKIVESLGEISRMLAGIYAAVEEHKIDNDLLGILSGNMSEKLNGLTGNINAVTEKMKSNVVMMEDIRSEVQMLKNSREAM